MVAARPGEPDPKITPTTPVAHAEVEAGIDKSQAIRKFSDLSIQAHIDQALAELPPDTRGAVVAYADNTGAKLAILGKAEVGPGNLAWTVVAAKPYDGPVEASAAVRYSW